MTNVIDFVRASAEYMVNSRPDAYDYEGAVETLWSEIETLRDLAQPFAMTEFTSFIMTRGFDDGVEYIFLGRKVSGLLLCEEEEDVRAFGFTSEVSLPHILDVLQSDDDS